MSGGYFDYNQYRLYDVADQIERVITNNDTTETDEYGYSIGRGYSPETIAKFREAVDTIQRAAAMAHRVDWLLSGDDNEESFHKRWNEDLEAYKWPNP